MQKSFESGGGDCRGRTPSAFPLLQCLEFGRHACGNESGDRLALAQTVGLPPDLSRRTTGAGVFCGKEVSWCSKRNLSSAAAVTG